MIESLGPLGFLGAIVVLLIAVGIAYVMRKLGITADL
jgi:hypothetical protein